MLLEHIYSYVNVNKHIIKDLVGPYYLLNNAYYEDLTMKRYHE